jgi:hypothetical protein
MRFPKTFAATGALLRLRQPDFDWQSTLGDTPVASVERLSAAGWLGLTLESKHPLVPEPEIRPIYEYSFLLRPTALGRFLITSTDLRLIDILLERFHIRRSVVRPSIKIHELVVNLCERPAEYTLGAVHTRIEGFGQALRNAAFYGNDVGEAVLFRELLGRMQGHRVTLRDARKRADIIGIGQKGDVSFAYHGADSLRDVDSALRFISRRGFLDWTASSETEGAEDGFE